MTERRRLLELALLGLEAEQQRIAAEIKHVRAELGQPSTTATRTLGTARRTAPNKGTPMSAAQKRKISLAMKRRWAEQRKGA